MTGVLVDEHEEGQRADFSRLERQLLFEARPFEAWLDALTKSREGLTSAARRFWQYNRNHIEELMATAAFERLRGLQQWGVKGYLGKDYRRAVRMPSAQSRYEHSVQVGAHAAALGMAAGRTDQELLYLAFAGLLHDIGHSAFSHTGDHVLVARGGEDHEARGQRIVRKDAWIGDVLRQAGLRAPVLVEVMREEGALGQLLALADTLAYVQHDTRVRMAALNRYDVSIHRQGADVVEVLTGATADRLEVQEIGPLVQILNRRRELGRRQYFSLPNRMATAAAMFTLSTLLDGEHLRAEEVAQGTDVGIAKRVTTILQDLSAGIHPSVRVAWKLAMQDLNGLPRWEYISTRDGRASGIKTPLVLKVPTGGLPRKVFRLRTHAAELSVALDPDTFEDQDDFLLVWRG